MKQQFESLANSTQANGVTEQRLLRAATYASVSIATVLIGIKVFAWLLTGSVSILASLVDSLMDIAASLINLFAVAHSLVPADKEHRFGHGKVESLAGLGQAVFIFASAIFLMVNAIGRLKNPVAIEEMEIGTSIIIVSMVLTVFLLLFQSYVVKRTGSLAIKADALHYRTDLITNAAILVALLLAYLGYDFFDPVFAILIAFYILYSAWGIAYDASQILLDRELPDEIRDRIACIAEAVPNVRGIHELRTRRSGITRFVQLHIDLDAEMSLKEAHGVADMVEAAICAEIPNADVIIHEDPVVS